MLKIRFSNIWLQISLNIFLIIGFVPDTGGQALIGKVDFKYAPLWWQSVISMPDANDKIVAGKDGGLLFDFIGSNLRDFGLQLKLETGERDTWQQQQTYSARVPIVITRSEGGGIEFTQEAFVVAPKKTDKESIKEGELTPCRVLLVVTATNRTDSKISQHIGLSVRSKDPVKFNASKNLIQAGNHTIISVTEQFAHGQMQADTMFMAMLPELILPPLESRRIVFTIDRNQPVPKVALTVEQASEFKEEAILWWKNSGLPYDVIQVPDSGIQEMVEACVRNIWQARDIEDGKIAYKVGPTVYRKLFVVDGAFLLETAAMLGRAGDARDGLELMLSHQEEDGSFNIIRKYYGVEGFTKENGIMLWAAFRHAQLSQDKEWLQAKWPALKRTVEVIQKLRIETTKTPGSLEYGLIPGGYIDGGLDNKPPHSKPEYSNVYWNLVGMKAAISAAHWLGDEKSASEWQPEYDEFYAAFRKAATRDMIKDTHGNSYLSTMMANADSFPPAKGQWAFCHSVYPGTVFPPDDILVEGQLAMLHDTKVEGLVFDTGWMKNGLWTYFASFYGHAMLWQGHGMEAVNSLYDFARHASPVRVWREEQKPTGMGNEEVGDMPHNWASAEFIRLTVHLLELDRGSELHLLEGFPNEWAAPGSITRLNGVLTPFGPLHMALIVDRDGQNAQLKIKKLEGSRPDKIVLHLSGLTGKDEVRYLPVDKDIDITIPLARNSRQN